MSTKIKLLFVAMAYLFTGCQSDYKLVGAVESPDPGVLVPEIEVDPLSHDFGALSAGTETHDFSVSVRNIGNGDLDISNVYLDGGLSNFTLTSVPSGIVEPMSETEIVVSYSPGTYEFNSDTIKILSNDEDEPVVNVFLDGSGDAPIITIFPSYHDFGTVYLGCDDTIPIEIGNIGNSNLIISDIEYFASLPVDFSIQEYESSWGLLPITISPGDTIDVNIDYIPLDDLDDSAYLEITSNDPVIPIASAIQDGLGGYEAWITDSFTQDGTVAVDILFVVDNSGSMSGNQSNLKNNFDDFMAVFVSAGVDYQVALITTDQSSFVGDVITPLTPDPVGEFEDQVDLIGSSGYAIEKGLWFAYESTTTGDASSSSSSGFLRSSARLVVVYISDEPDGSTSMTYGGGSTTMTPSDYSASLLSLKTSSDLVVAHAVAGDYPSGCSSNGGATFGDGYYDVVNDLGGTFMSICDSDWSVTMDTLARDSMSILSFPLSDTPIEDTIAATVDGVASTDWTYDYSTNSVTFTVAPSDGSTINITYAVWSDCGGE
tara:strand:+ start:6425 stop:8056 length:1632 start_codon:yes stop_codon:yes gene_type:complete